MLTISTRVRERGTNKSEIRNYYGSLNATLTGVLESILKKYYYLHNNVTVVIWLILLLVFFPLGQVSFIIFNRDEKRK